MAANPVASNIVVMKAEYGINTSLSPERELDTWVQATAGGGLGPDNAAAGADRDHQPDQGRAHRHHRAEPAVR